MDLDKFTPEEQEVLILSKKKLETKDRLQWGEISQLTEKKYVDFLNSPQIPSPEDEEETDRTSIKFGVTFYSHKHPDEKPAEHLYSAKGVLYQISKGNWVVSS